MTRRRLGPGNRFDVASAVDGLRQFVARADAQGRAVEDLIELAPWGDDDDCDRDRLERLAHLVGGMVEALAVAMAAGDELAVELAKRPTGAAHADR
jgi:hypothetical protein